MLETVEHDVDEFGHQGVRLLLPVVVPARGAACLLASQGLDGIFDIGTCVVQQQFSMERGRHVGKSPDRHKKCEAQ